MTENTSSPTKKIRKIKKIKVARNNEPLSFGTPTKVNYNQPQDSFLGNTDDDLVFDNNGAAENIRFITEADMQSGEPNSLKDFLQNKNVLMLMFIAAMIGALLGYISAPKSRVSTGRGLEGVVFNQDVPKGRSRCGLVEQHQPCVLYIMNPKTQEVSGKDFYTTAAKWTGRERYMIEMSNMHYGAQRIKPGNIAQINIPSL